MPSEVDWGLIRTFLAIYRTGSFVDAAFELGVDESTIRRRMAQLERILGTSVMARYEGRLTVAPEHLGLVDHALRMESNVEHFLDLAQVVRRSGVVRVSMIDLFAIELARDIAEFTTNHPEVLLDITTEPQIVDLRRDGVDVAIRMARPRHGQEKLRKLGQVSFGVYGSQDYLARIDGANSRPTFIALGVHYPHADHQFELSEDNWLGDLARLGKVAIMADCYPAMLRLCEFGAGLAALPRFIANANPKLRPYRADEINLDVGIWAVVRPEVARLPKVRKAMEFLAAAIHSRIT
jgi:DNA-binding transcriptional LysR family regulator